MVNKGSPKVAHASAGEHLADESVRYYNHPYPRSFIVELFQAADALLLLIVLCIVFLNLFSGERTRLTLLANDLERGGDDGDQQGYEPQTQNKDPNNEEKRADQVIGIGHGVEQIRPGVRGHDNKNQLERLENVVEAFCVAKRINILDAERTLWA